jgi:DNA polymerase elongation subunit (family B)
MPKKIKNKKTKKPITFQIVDYYDQDQTNKDLGIVDAPENTSIPKTASYVGRKNISWWNWFKDTKYPELLNYRLYLFGRTDTGKSVSVHVRRFTPYMFIKLPEHWNKKSPEIEKFKEWILKQMWLTTQFMPKKIPAYDPSNTGNNNKIDYRDIPCIGCVDNKIKCKECRQICEDQNISSNNEWRIAKKCPARWHAFYNNMKQYGIVNEMWDFLGIDIATSKVVKRKQLKEFTNEKKFPFLCMIAKSKRSFNALKRVFQHNKNDSWDNYESAPTPVSIPECDIEDHIFDLYEADINPICRFTDHSNVKGCGWVQINDYTDPISNFTKCKIDIETSWKNVKPIDRDGLAKMVMAFYDIECDSSHGDFPQANKKYTGISREILTEYQRLYKIRQVQRRVKKSDSDAKHHDKTYEPTEREVMYLKYKLPCFEWKFVKKLLEDAMINEGSDENNISQIYWKDISHLSMNSHDLYEKERTDYLKTIDENLNMIRTTKTIEMYMNGIDELYKILNKKYVSKRVCEYIEKNMENAKIVAFKNIAEDRGDKEGNILQGIISECASRIHPYICGDYTNRKLSSELSSEKQRNITTCQNILDKYFPPIKGDPIIQIGTCLQRQGEAESYRKHILTLGTCDKIPGVEVVVCDTESELIMKWKQLLEDEDVDSLLGWNNYDFDYPYIWDRAEATGVLEQYRTLSRFKAKKSIKKEKRLSSSALGDNIWYDIDNVGRVQIDLMRVVRDDVTVNLDRYTLDHVSSVFMRGAVKNCVYNETEDETTIFTNSTTGLHAESYIKFSYIKCHTEDYYGDNAKLKISEILVDGSGFKIKGNIDLKANEHKYSWSMAKDDVSPQDIFRMQQEGPAERCIIAKYCVKDVVLCVELCQKLTVIVNKSGMSNVCCVPLLWIFTRGQTAKTYSLVAKECRSLGFVLPTLYRPDSATYAGAVVLKPTPGIYLKRPVAVLDFGSLYPSIIINCNMSHETLIKDPKYLGKKGDKRLNKMGIKYKDIPIYVWEMVNGVNQKVVSKVNRFKQPKEESDGSVKEVNRGIIPRILLKLLGARASTRAKAKYKTVTLTNGDEYSGLYSKDKAGIIGTVKTHKGEKHEFHMEDVVLCVDTYTDFEKDIFNGLQLAYKVTANSVYGLLGATVSPIYCPEIASSTTAEGRRLLEFSGDYACKNYNNKEFTYTNLNGQKQDILIEKTDVVYGDTDSIFVLYHIKDMDGNYIYNREAVKASIDISLDVEEQITPIFGYPHKLEYEKTFWPFILISKKRYAGDKYEFNPHKAKQTSMGLVTKRRDNAKIVKYVFGGILDIIMGQKDLQKSIDFLQECVRNIMNNKFDFDKFIITKKLSAFYKNPDRIAHKVLADRMAERDPGNKPKSNERLPFAFVEVKGNKKKMLQGDRIEHPSFIKDNGLELDYEHYITNQVSKPVSQIFGLELENLDEKYDYPFPKDFYKKRYDHWYNRYKEKGKQFPDVDAEKKIRQERTKKAQELLIDPIIRQIKEHKRIRKEAEETEETEETEEAEEAK